VLPWLANWWDAIALWLSDLAFPFQFALVIAVLAPLCVVVAWAIDRAVDVVTARLTRSKDQPSVRVRAVPMPAVMHGRADVPAGTPATIITSIVTEQRHEHEQMSASSDAVHS
jgi:membrane protein implicated in regulation of membrane protease activity